MDTSCAVMGVDGDFGGVTITLDYLEEDGEVKLVAEGINVPRDVITDNCKARKGRNGVMGEGRQGRFCNLSIKSRAAFYIDILIIIFVNDFKVFDKSIPVDSSGLFSMVQLKLSSSGSDINIRRTGNNNCVVWVISSVI